MNIFRKRHQTCIGRFFFWRTSLVASIILFRFIFSSLTLFLFLPLSSTCPFFPLLSTRLLNLVGFCSTLVALGLMRNRAIYGGSKPGGKYWQISWVHNYCLGFFFFLVFLMNSTCCARFISYLFEHVCSCTSVI